MVFVLLLGLISSSSLRADESEQDFQALGARLIDYGESLEFIATDFESNRLRMRDELSRLQSLVDRKEIDIERALSDAEALEEKILLSRELQGELNAKYEQINLNFKKFVFQTRAQKLIPFLYAGVAVAIADGNLGDKALFGLAGYGTGALVLVNKTGHINLLISRNLPAINHRS